MQQQHRATAFPTPLSLPRRCQEVMPSPSHSRVTGKCLATSAWASSCLGAAVTGWCGEQLPCPKESSWKLYDRYRSCASFGEDLSETDPEVMQWGLSPSNCRKNKTSMCSHHHRPCHPVMPTTPKPSACWFSPCCCHINERKPSLLSPSCLALLHWKLLLHLVLWVPTSSSNLPQKVRNVIQHSLSQRNVSCF